MNVGELFIKLGIKGDDTAKSAAKGVTNALDDVKSSGLAAKAAVLGAVYGLEQLTSNAAKFGSDMTHFSDSTGIAIETLQRWNEEGRKHTTSQEEVQQGLANTKKIMDQIAVTKTAPGMFGVFAANNGVDLDKASKDIDYFQAKLQEFAKGSNEPLVREAFGSMGYDKDFFRLMKLSTDDVSKLKYTGLGEKGIRGLDKMEGQWMGLKNKMSTFGFEKALQFGPDAISKLSGAVTELEKLDKQFESLMKHSEGFKDAMIVIGTIAAVTFAPLTSAVGALILLLDDLNKGDKSIVKNGLSSTFKWRDSDQKAWESMKKGMNDYFTLPHSFDEFMTGKHGASQGSTGEKNFNQTINIHGGSGDPKHVGQEAGKGAQHAFRSSPANTWMA